VDLRGINSLIAPKIVQLPNIDDILHDILSKKPLYLSSIDLRSAYWQHSVSPESRKYTAFTGPSGKRWQFRRVPFGLHNSASELLQNLGAIFGDKNTFHNTALYFDDILVYNSNFSDHLEHLRLVFQTLRENDYSCNPKKTEIAMNEIEYLGFRIDSQGLHISEKRIQAIQHITRPKNVKGVQRILGLLNFFRKYIRNYAKNTFHMRQLLRKGVKFVWTQKCDEELAYLKNTLSNPPILRPLNPNSPIWVMTDGSSQGLGFAILERDSNGDFYVIQYGAKATNPAQQSYSSSDLELMSLIYALKAIEPITITRPVYVCTDNAHVLRLHKWNPVNHRQKCMITYLMMFDLRITYIKGCRNVVPDCLSRIFTDVPEFERNKHAPQPIQEADDFLFPVTTRSRSRPLDDAADAPRQADQLIPQHHRQRQQPLQQQQSGQTHAQTPLLQPQQTVESSTINDSSTIDRAPPTDASSTLTDADADANAEAEELDPLTDLWDDDDADQSDKSEQDLITIPPISATDYIDDVEFGDMYRYLSNDELPENKKSAKTILLTADHYIIKDAVLYRLDSPRTKKMAKLVPMRKRLCIPLLFRNGILTHMHENCGHYALEKLFLALSNRFYWKSLYQDTHDFVKLCDTCLKAKPNFGNRPVPLNPISPPFYPGQSWSIDRKILTRKTAEGNHAILVVVCAFSGWPYLLPGKDLSALTTAEAFVKNIICTHGFPARLYSDKSSSYINSFFKKVCLLLGIKHRTSASLCSRSNGLAESMVKHLSSLLKIYAFDDITLEQQLPLMELSIRVIPQSRLGLSPFQIMLGYDMNVNVPGQTSLACPFSGSSEVYYCFLSREVKRLHEEVRKRKLEIKEEDKRHYDKYNRVKDPDWKQGDLVLLQDLRVKQHSDKVVTHRPYHGPMIIEEVVQKDPDVGPAYKLKRLDGKRQLKLHVTADRLKHYNTDRAELEQRLPPLKRGDRQ